MPLYECPCKSFSSKINLYRKIVQDTVIAHAKNTTLENKIKTLHVIFFEPGGFLDEYKIISSIIKYRKKNKDHFCIKIYCLEEEIETNKKIKKAFKLFKKLLSKYQYIEILMFSSATKLNKAILKISTLEYLIITALDEYYFLYDFLFKSKDEIENILNKTKESIIIRMHLKKNYFYTNFLSISISKKLKKQVKIFNTNYFGDNRAILKMAQRYKKVYEKK